MPRPSTQRIGGAEVAPVQRAADKTAVVASPVDTFVRPPQNEYEQLAAALGSIHAPLAQMQQRQDEQLQKKYNEELAAKAATSPRADSAEGAELAAGHVPPAYRPGAMDAYSRGIGERLGIDAKNAYLDAYTAESKKPGFNFEAFSADFRAKHLTGLDGAPALAVGAAKHIDEGISAASGHYRQLLQERQAADNVSTLGAQFADAVNPWATAEINKGRAESAIEQYVQGGGVRAEGVKALFSHITALSTQNGGRPDLFDVFTEKDATGKSMAAYNPNLADNIAKGRIQASEQERHRLFKDGLEQRSIAYADLEKGLDAGEFDHMDTPRIRETLMPHVGEMGIFNSDKELASFEHRIYERQAKIAVREEQRRIVAQGGLASLPHAAQRELLMEAVGDQVQTVVAGMNDPKQADSVSAALRTIVQRSTGASVGLDPIKGLIGSLKNVLPDGKNPRPVMFDHAVRFYQDLKASGNPRIVAEYGFDDDLQHVMESYIRDTAGNQLGSDTAYVSAYRVLDPAAREQADKLLKDPASLTKLNKKVDESVIAFWRRWTPLANTPDTSTVKLTVQDEVKRWLAQNPDEGIDKAIKFADRWSKNNLYSDPATNAVIHIPQALNSPASQEALTAWMKMVQQAHSKGDNKVTPRLSHKGNGVYSLGLVSSKGGFQIQGDVDLHDILSVAQAQKNISGDEFRKLGEMRSKIQSGTFTPEDGAANAMLIQRAADLGVLTPDTKQSALNARTEGLRRESNTLDAAVKKADGKGVSPGAALRDPDQHSAPVAMRFLRDGDLHGALTAMGERVRLVAYKDPARGMNIGLGYNFAVNGADVPKDFKRAGIPVEYLEDIQAGKRAITVEQAMRLYKVAGAKAESRARSAYGADEYDKLPKNARAVLTDLAYQTGNISVFQNGLAHLREGDFSGAGLQSSFIDRGTQQRRVDERRHALRVAMLKNVTSFQTLLNNAAKQPSSPLEARAVVANATSP